MYYKGFSRLIILLALGMHIQQGSVRLKTHGHGCLAGFVESDGVPTSPVEPPEAAPDGVAPAPAEPADNDSVQDVVLNLRANPAVYRNACDVVRQFPKQYPKDIMVCGFVNCCLEHPDSDPKSIAEDCFLDLVCNLIVEDVNIKGNCASAAPTYSPSDCKFVRCCVDASKRTGYNLENMGKDCYDSSYDPAGSTSSPPATAAAALPPTLTTPILYGLNVVTLVYFL